MSTGMDRRQFLKAAATSALGAVVFAGCAVPKRELLVESPVRMPEDLVTGADNWYATVCRQCPAGCGVIVRVMEGRAKKIEGNPDYPINRGKLCARGQAGVQALYHPDRVTGPLRRDRATGQFSPISWNDALDLLGARLKALRGQPDTVVLATEPLRGSLATLVDGFVRAYGAASHLTLEPLESTPLWDSMARLTSPILSSYTLLSVLPEFDIANTRYLLSFGADFLSTELSPVRYSLGYGEFRHPDESGRGTFVQVEPRFSMTGANADRWVPVRPGTEGVLALSLAYVMISEGLADSEAARAMTGGRGADALSDFQPERAAAVTGVPAGTIVEIARAFATQRPSLAVGGGPAAAQTNGTFNLTAIYALNFLTGGVGALGGMALNPVPPKELPRAARPPSPFASWRRLAEQMRTGQPRPVNLIMFRGVNPVYSLPTSLGFAEALARIPLVVSFASIMDETATLADLVLPEHTYLEDWGDDVPVPGPGYQVVGYQQPVVLPVHDTRGFADVLLVLAQEVGSDMEQSLPWKTYRDMVRDGARELHSLGRGSIVEANIEAFWNRALQNGGWWDASDRYTGPLPQPQLLPTQAPTPEFAGDPHEFPLHLVPFASHSLGDGRGAHLPWLQATPDPITSVAWQTWVEVGRQTARQNDLEEGTVVSVESPQGRVEAAVYVNPALPPEVVAVPLGQGHSSYGRYAQGRGANILSILAPLEDRENGALAWAATRVRLVKAGRRQPIPKFEGTMFAAQVPGSEVIEVTRP
ncbi:MAG: molybdopterin-dependent oxidoreductase [Chloroflexi bacterium]|nr:molybdopterin-dependent oxidoreductase [Chloroflexota bacterium]